MRTTGNPKKVPLLFALFFLFSINSVFSQSDVVDIINPGVSGTWHPDTLYRVHVNIFVAEEDTLTILPGTKVEFLGNKRFEVSGVLIAEGEQNNRIQFSKVATSDEKWNGLRLMSAKRTNYISKIGFCDFSYVNDNDGAALSVNSGVSDIKNCSFSHIDSNGIVIQSGSPVESMLFSNNSFLAVDGYPINIYQNFSLSQIDVKNNQFTDCFAGLFVSISQISSINIDNNSIDDSEIGASFVFLSGNPVLENITCLNNNFNNVSGADDSPYLFDIFNNETLELFSFTNNNIEGSLRIASVRNATNVDLKDNIISNSENLVFEHLYNLECNDITIDHEVIHNVDLKELGANYISLYSLVPGNEVVIENCDVENITANCFYIHPQQSFESLLISDNDVTDCNSEFNDGGILRLESASVQMLNEVKFTNNSFTDVQSKDFGGIAKIDLDGCVISNFVSDGNTYVSETGDAGGVFHIACNEIKICNLNNDVVDGTILDSSPDSGTGGFMALNVINTPDTLSVSDYVVEKAYAVSHGGFMFVNIASDQKDMQYLNLNNISIKDVVSESGNGGFLGITTPAGIDKVEISNVTTEGSYIRKAISGGFLYLNTQHGPDIISISGCDLTNVTANELGGHAAIISQGDINEFFVNDNEFSSDPTSGILPTEGGAFYVAAENINNTVFSDNSFTDIHADGNGGMMMIAVNQGLTTQVFQHNTFLNGSSGAMGGGVYVSANSNLDEKLIFQDNTFTNILSDDNGGAICFSLKTGALSKGVLLQDNVFESCAAQENGAGGAIFFEAESILDSVFIYRTHFENCNAVSSGGAVYLDAKCVEKFYVDGEATSGFNNCYSTEGSGGSIYLNSFDAAVKELEFYNIEANGGSGLNAAGRGGLIYFSSKGDLQESLKIHNLNISGFSSGESGGVFDLNFYDHAIIGDLDVASCSFNDCKTIGDDACGGIINLVAGKLLSDISVSENTIQNCEAGLHGGAYHFNVGEINSVNLIENNSFSGCRALNGNGGAVSVEMNGALSGDINVFDNNFDGGTQVNAGGSGGAISISGFSEISGMLNVKDSHFESLSSTSNGGAISLNADDNVPLSKIKICNNVISDCSAEGSNSDGGAMYVHTGAVSDSIVIFKNIATGAEASGNGGCFSMDVSNASHLLIDGEQGIETFKNCKAINQSGGAIYCNIRNGGLEKLAVTNNTFNGDNAVSAGENGGALSIVIAGDIIQPVLLEGNAFSNLKSTGNGGAIYLNTNGNDLLDGVEVRNNEFNDLASIEGNGGAISIDMNNVPETILFNDNIFSGSSAGLSGGALFLNANNVAQVSVSPQNTAMSFTNCEAINGNGGAIALSINNSLNIFEVLDNSFEDCKCGINGGAISLTTSTIDTLIIHGQGSDKGFTNCVAENGNGGAINVVMAQGEVNLLELSENLFDGCNAGMNGGAVNVSTNADIKAFNVLDNICSNGSAGVDGGAIASTLDGATAVDIFHVLNNEFTSLVAGRNGGALIISGTNIEGIDVLNSIFSDCNTVSGNGGAFYISDDVNSLTFEEDTFSGCYAGSGDGGAVYVSLATASEGTIEFSDLTFANSGSQTMNGGAAFLFGANDITIENCFCSNLEVSSRGGALYLQDIANITLSDNNFSQCSSNESAGAIWAQNNNNGMISLSGSHFEFNSSKYFGGALYVKGFSDFHLTDCEMLQNAIFANGNEAFGGGAVYAEEILYSVINENFIFDNHAENDNTIVPTYGGGFYLNLCDELKISNNDMRLNEAVSGGAVFVNDDHKTTFNKNVFTQNDAIHGGALGVKSATASMDSLLISDNDFMSNVAGYRGGAVYSDRDKSFLVRNKFIRNIGKTDDLDIKVKGSSVYFSRDVMRAEIYNSVFDRNEDLDVDHSDNATIYLDASTGSSFKSERLLVENCSFLKNWPYAAHVIFNRNVLDTVNVRNAVFQGNVLPNDSLFNNASIISDYSRLEGELYDVEHTNALPDYYPYNLEDESYMLVSTSQYIDLGNPDEIYNDNFMPPGLGETINDPGHTGGRYNAFCEDCLDKPEAWMYNDSLVVLRTDCDTYSVSFFHSMASSFDHFQWFIDGETFVTEENLLEFTYPAEKNVLLLALAYSATDELTMAGRAWIYNREIVHDGLAVSYSPDGTLAEVKSDEVTIEVTYGDDCLENISLEAELKNLIIPDPDSFEYFWDIEASEGIVDAEVQAVDEDHAVITLSIDKDFVNSQDLYINLSYSGEDGCGLQCADEMIIRFSTTGFNTLDLIEVSPENGDNIGYEQFYVVELTMNQVCGYLTNNYNNIPLNQNIRTLNLMEFTDGTTTFELDSVKAIIIDDKMHFMIYPDTSNLVLEETYTVIIADNVVTECGWSVEPYDYEFTIVEVGIDDYSIDISVRPNPVHETLFVNTGNSFSGEITIYNVAGDVVKTIVTETNELRLDVSGLSKGVYILEYRSEGNRVLKKIVKE